MTRTRQRHSGLLPRMEARPRSDGLTTYRYHPLGGKPINLGTDLGAAIRRVLDMNGDNSDRGTIAELWRLYRESPAFTTLAPSTRLDYEQAAVPLLRVFSAAQPAAVKPKAINRYLRVERADAPVRANHEIALLNNLLNLAVERGDIDANPCRQVRKNKERPKRKPPETALLLRFIEWAQRRPGQAQVLIGMAEFAALSGNRRIEFRELHWTQVGPTEIRLMRAKQRERETVEVLRRSPAMDALLARMRALASDDRTGAVFPNRAGNPYTDSGFKSMWNKLVLAAVADGVLQADTRFSFHSLRSYYVTAHKRLRGALPDLHANPATTAAVYDASTEVKRDAL